MRRRKSLRNNSSLSVQSDTQELTFLTYQEEVTRLRENQLQQREGGGTSDQHSGQYLPSDFTQEQREHLKNAFRYICRLAFKESSKYIVKIRELSADKWHHKLPEGEFRSRLVGLLKEAEMISGERYFKEYLENLRKEDQATIVNYMIWFLERKYLRYLRKTECEKGKRKNMKKELYIRFKNEIMLPYLQNHLVKLGEQQASQ